jgi:hypothetical protein
VPGPSLDTTIHFSRDGRFKRSIFYWCRQQPTYYYILLPTTTIYAYTYLHLRPQQPATTKATAIHAYNFQLALVQASHCSLQPVAYNCRHTGTSRHHTALNRQPTTNSTQPSACSPVPTTCIPQPATHITQPTTYSIIPAANGTQPTADNVQPSATTCNSTLKSAAYRPQPATHSRRPTD